MPGQPILLFDGDCAFCRGWSRRLARWDRAGRIRQLPYQDRAAVPGLPAIDVAELDRALQVILPDGRIVAGARGIVALLPWLPGGQPLGWLAKAPGVRWMADRVYGAVARRRRSLSCRAGNCGAR